ncbi:MAG: hypothetical protein IT462_12530 [Planctomycetes bacterium]|nr:hypothetical protein [Planctomycetota bacterium]
MKPKPTNQKPSQVELLAEIATGAGTEALKFRDTVLEAVVKLAGKGDPWAVRFFAERIWPSGQPLK